MSELKPCPFCGNKFNEGHKETCYFRSRNKGYAAREESWQSRPIEDAWKADAEQMYNYADHKYRCNTGKPHGICNCGLEQAITQHQLLAPEESRSGN